MKKWLWIVIIVGIASAFIVNAVITGSRQLTSELIGIAHTIPGRLNGVYDYEIQLKRSRDFVLDPKMTWESYRAERAEELRYEIEICDVMRTIFAYLVSKDMITDEKAINAPDLSSYAPSKEDLDNRVDTTGHGNTKKFKMMATPNLAAKYPLHPKNGE